MSVDTSIGGLSALYLIQGTECNITKFSYEGNLEIKILQISFIVTRQLFLHDTRMFIEMNRKHTYYTHCTLQFSSEERGIQESK